MTIPRRMSSFLFFFLLAGLAGSQGADTLTITLHRSFLRTPKIALTSVDMISSESTSIGQLRRQTSNQVSLHVIVPRPQFAFLEIDGAFLPLYLEPRGDLHLYMASTDLLSIRFEGTSALTNTYLAKAQAIRLRAEQSAGKHYINLPLPEFVAHLSAIRTQYEQLNQTILAKADLADSLQHLLIARNQVGLLFMQQNYVVTHYGEKLTQVPEPLKASLAPPLFDPDSFALTCQNMRTLLIYTSVIFYGVFSRLRRRPMNQWVYESISSFKKRPIHCLGKNI